MIHVIGGTSIRAALLAAVSMSGLALAEPAWAQNAPAPAAVADQPDGEIVVTGYRASLQSSTNAKRESTGFTDSIFAEDIGKFPDTNIAESFNRIPGITISRETTGEGQEVTIRGLGTNFTKVLLNGAPVAIASTGRTDSQNTNREVDLDLFPTELFTQLVVHKSSSAEMLEGGAAGTIDMRSARPFDHAGKSQLSYSGQLTKNSNADKWGYRGALLASMTSGNFGVLAGVAGVRSQTRVTGYETIGLTNPNLSATQSTSATRNSTGGGNWTIPGTVPANAGNGLTTGDTIDQAYLLAHNPGANITQIDNGLIPRLGRPSDESGPRNRVNAIVSLEFKSDSFHAYVDGMWAYKKNDLRRFDMNWVGRNGAAIPLNTQYDQADCTNGCVVTKGTYANAQFFLEYRPFIETTHFWGVNPGFDVKLSDTLKFDAQANYTKSVFHRESPTLLVITPASSGITVNYDNSGGDFPNITASGVNLNNPSAFGWPGGRVNIQDERRHTLTKGARANLTWGDEKLNLKVGAAYDDVSRRIEAYDNSQAWQNAVCGDQPSVFVPGPNTQPPCEGLNTPTPPSNYPTYPALGTGYSTGMSGPVRYARSLIPQAALSNYLMPGPDGFVTVDWTKFVQDSKYNQFHDAEAQATSSNTSANAGFVGEKSWGAYGQINGKLDLGDNRLDYNAGVRWVHTDQTIGGFVSIADVRNISGANTCPAPSGTRDGSCYPNALNFVYTNASYSNWLPSANAAFHIGEHAVVRAAVSRTMTRANPNAMLPGLNFSSPSADTGSVGNPSLSPYTSDNIDVGFEYYTGHEGYLGFAAFRKAVKGYTTTGNATVPFSSLASYGVTFDTLTPTQQSGICGRAGVAVATCTAASVAAQTVTLSQQVNSSGTLKVDGLEFNWVQPLDFLIGRYLGVNGFGFTANLTLIGQSGSDAATSSATTGVAPVTYNLTAYYDHAGISARVSTTFTRGSASSTPGQNGISAAALFSDDYQQWDFGGGIDLAKILGQKGLPELTLDVINIGKAQQRAYFQFQNAAFTVYQPGRQIMIGLRGRF